MRFSNSCGAASCIIVTLADFVLIKAQLVATLYYRDFGSIFSHACGAAASTIAILANFFLTEAQPVTVL